ncbi:uncharacterized protein F4807DRAFT_35530 [Annulohypoxylon truncatum]|uniref:uncharacterized protein n=1 Tax=Annulohypoxylon truncatum TaxID=327061 RepID=UPI0020074B55|nr:uncharacterized protein F4807DRAFT_35530 [Annulohypoxylon truncatum]KAI1211340.1 hypothetical protein F4807DRAFT_35530 [Annulohypoxylon truncatum]
MVYRGPYEELRDANKYDFITELTPGVWKICRKVDRMEYLAHDITDKLTSNPSNTAEGDPTDLQQLLTSERTNIIEPLKAILNHGHIVSLIDIFSVQTSDARSELNDRHYAVWEFCDAGNLGNLLVSGQRRFPKASGPIMEGLSDEEDEGGPIVYDDDQGDTIRKNFLEKIKSRTKDTFLPESLCWHVLVSVIRALAWLHEGSEPVPPGEDGRITFAPDVDWEPILHRNIVPENIFFMHPKRSEWYGSCKLGNYCNAFISGHHNGYQEKPEQTRVRSEALAPSRDQGFQPLKELIKLDEEFSHTYPQQPNQPYTRVSELRAVGEILQAMMVSPGYEGNHVAAMRENTVYNNLKDVDYSHTLKNIVVWLMEFNPDQKLENGEYRWNERGRNYMTTLACTNVQRQYEAWFNSSHPEARKMIPIEVELGKQKYEDDIDMAKNIEYLREINRVLEKQDNLVEVFYGKPEKEKEVDISATASTGGVA